MRNVFWMILVCTYFFLAGCGGGGGDGGGGGVSELPNSPSPGTPAQNPVIPGLIKGSLCVLSWPQPDILS